MNSRIALRPAGPRSAQADSTPFGKRIRNVIRESLSQRGWLLSVLALALLIGQLPMVLAACCAPADATGLGTVWFVNDFAQYESAMRQGAEQSGWLIHDAFTAEPHADAFMFPLYVGEGKLAAPPHLPAARPGTHHEMA